jgi:hypothetical protein
MAWDPNLQTDKEEARKNNGKERTENRKKKGLFSFLKKK